MEDMYSSQVVYLLFTSKWQSSNNTSLKHSHQETDEEEHLALLHGCKPKP